MAVSLPSDLILDVIRNAEPARQSAATEKLRSLQNREGSPTHFASVLGSTDTSRKADPTAPNATAGGPYVEFERMVLRNLFESLLPKSESGAFGSGPSAGIWRSLAADQLAGLYANSGGVGIASSLAADEQQDTAKAHWPYFTSAKIEAFTG